jgi:hypothetical protein
MRKASGTEAASMSANEFSDSAARMLSSHQVRHRPFTRATSTAHVAAPAATIHAGRQRDQAPSMAVMTSAAA